MLQIFSLFVCQKSHLINHSFLVIIEPPDTSLLIFSCGTAVLETAQNGSDGSIIGWIQGVENGFWQFP